MQWKIHELTKHLRYWMVASQIYSAECNAFTPNQVLSDLFYSSRSGIAQDLYPLAGA